MPKGPNGQKRPADAIGAAVMVGRIATGEIEDVIKTTSGRAKSGKAGGVARAAKLDRSARSEIAAIAANSRWKQETANMATSAKDRLLSLLFDEGRELVNLKFFPGVKASSEEDFCIAVHDMISRALDGEGAGVVPKLSGAQRSIGDLVNLR